MADKRSLKVRIIPNRGALYEIYYEGGGEVPEVLKGAYTSNYDAERRIIMHLSMEKQRLKEAADRKRKSERMEELRERDLA